MSAFMWDSGKWFWMRNAHDKPIPIPEQVLKGLIGDSFASEKTTFVDILKSPYQPKDMRDRYAAILLSDPEPTKASLELHAALLARVRG